MRRQEILRDGEGNGYKIKRVLGDGDCGFRSILGGSYLTGGFDRAEVINSLEAALESGGEKGEKIRERVNI